MSAAILVTLGCGGADAPAEDESASSTGGEVEASGPALADMAWEDVPEDQRGQWMAEVVVPAMQPVFAEHDATRFADFGCATCHGEDAAAVHFEMPNGVAPLNPADIPAMFQSEQPMAQFMVQTVWPQMTELLGEAPYDAETHEGFSCMNCHAMAEAADPG
ncbi:MAG: hypothetical protein AB8I08_19050 [Sandaracinaceae bacterium]